MTAPADHEAYIAQAPEAFREALTHLRGLLVASLPQAEEIIAYGMPGFRLKGQTVAGYAAFSKSCGLYLLPEAIAAHAVELEAEGLKASKTGVTFTPRKPIPDDLVTRLAATSRRQALAS